MLEQSIDNIEHILGRKLTGEELLIIGMTYRDGFSYGVKYANMLQAKGGVLPEKPKRKDTKETEE